MRKYIALLSLSLSLLATSTGCSAELIDTLLSEDAVSESSANKTQANAPIGGGLAQPSTNNQVLTTPGNFEEDYAEDEFIGDGFDPAEEQNYSPPQSGSSGPEDEFVGDGFDPALEGSTGGTTSNDGTNLYFNEFLGYQEAYFGPSDGYASMLSGLSGNDAAGSRFGGPDNAVGILVTHRDRVGYITVVNLKNKRSFEVYRDNGSLFTVPADTLNGRPFPSLFVTSIPSLTQFSFEHRTSPNPPKCSYYTATYAGTATEGSYTATLTGSGGCTY